MNSLNEVAKSLSNACNKLTPKLEKKVSWVYNPLDYAWEVHKQYLRKYGDLGGKTILLGMNPGPWGMGQTGVPFGDVSKVRDYLGLSGDVGQPERLHPKRPVIGLDSNRNEVSGTRLWGVIEDTFGSADEAHTNLFVVNHCPLLMFDEAGKNLTPDKLSGHCAKELLELCDLHLQQVVDILGATQVIGVGAYAEKQAKKALVGMDIEITRIPHPSPASPLANRNGGADWRHAVKKVLSEL
jgi:single-strand selective monofunctional uracil DNA glycosylase